MNYLSCRLLYKIDTKIQQLLLNFDKFGKMKEHLNLYRFYIFNYLALNTYVFRLYRCTVILHSSIGNLMSPHSKFIKYDISCADNTIFLDPINDDMFPSSSNKVNDNLCIFLKQILFDHSWSTYS